MEYSVFRFDSFGKSWYYSVKKTVAEKGKKSKKGNKGRALQKNQKIRVMQEEMKKNDPSVCKMRNGAE